MSTVEGKCALCLNHRELRDSHIISSFHYKPLKGDRNEAFLIISTNPEVRTRPDQKGITEHLLCGECEQRRSRWEGYVARKFNHEDLFSDEFPYVVEGLDYRMVKLYQLSILFVASVSSIREFENLKLAPEREETLRRMVYKEEPGSPLQFGCVMYAALEESFEARAFMLTPKTLCDDASGAVYHRFLFDGFFWMFIDHASLSRGVPQARELARDMSQRVINRDGRLVIDGMPLVACHQVQNAIIKGSELGRFDDDQ